MSATPRTIPLTPDERATLSEHETIIAAGISSFVEVGTRLLDIAEKRLYRETHGSFEPYCRERWSMSARRAYQLCEAAKVVNELPEHLRTNGSQITNERQARELSTVPKAKRQEVLEKAVETGKNPTAKEIKEAALEVIPPFDNPPRVRTYDKEFMAACGSPAVALTLTPLAREVLDALDVQSANDTYLRECISGASCERGAIEEAITHCGALAKLLRKYLKEVKA